MNKMNFSQQIGLAGSLGGIILLGLRLYEKTANAILARIPIHGGLMEIKLPPDWAIAAFLIGGLLLLALGTSWKAIRGERHSESAAD